jgi:hypothetical protein
MDGAVKASFLPVELERPIFEHAARADRITAQKRVYVARRVRIWQVFHVYTSFS